MILIKKIKPGLWQPNEQETGAIMAIAKKGYLADGLRNGELGMIRYAQDDTWRISMQGGYESRRYETFQKMAAEEVYHFDFFYIEIKMSI